MALQPLTAYQQLDAERIVETAGRLALRVGERFPEAGLSRIAAAVADTARHTHGRIVELARPNWLLRAGATFCIGFLLLLVLYGMRAVLNLEGFERISEVLQAVESLVNEVILLGLACAFFLGLERRRKRGHALRQLHELRSIAHIIDMHQLTKDPEHFLFPIPDTASSPRRIRDSVALSRYLDYCSELLSLVSKLAALYGQALSDTVVFSAVNDIESLVSGLQRKIWQKLTILNSLAVD